MLPWINYRNDKQAKSVVCCHKQVWYQIKSYWKPKSFHITLTYLSLQKVYLCGIILQSLSCTCWTHTNITGSRLARVLHVLLLSRDYSCHRLSRAQSPCYSRSRKWKQRGYIASKQVNHVKFLKLLMEIRELQLFWSQPSKRWLFILPFQKKHRGKVILKFGEIFWPLSKRKPTLWILRRHCCSHDQRSHAGLRGDGTRSSHPHFVLRELSGLKQTALPRISRPQPISAQQHLPINPRWQAAARGTTPPLCVPPGAEPPEGFNEDRQEVGEDGLSRKWPHTDSGIQRTENRFIRESGMRMARKYTFISIWGGDGKRLFFMKNTNNSTRNLHSRILKLKLFKTIFQSYIN